jgi:hypothetical protein
MRTFLLFLLYLTLTCAALFATPACVSGTLSDHAGHGQGGCVLNAAVFSNFDFGRAVTEPERHMESDHETPVTLDPGEPRHKGSDGHVSLGGGTPWIGGSDSDSDPRKTEAAEPASALIAVPALLVLFLALRRKRPA